MNPKKYSVNFGFTLVELLVTLVVSSIVISATVAGFTFFSKQYQILNQRIQMDQNVLPVIDLMQSDIFQAGFKAYSDGNPEILAIDVIQGLSDIEAKDSFSIVYDSERDDGSLYRLIVYYYSEFYKKDPFTGADIYYLKRDIRECQTPDLGCKMNPGGNFPDSISLYSGVRTGPNGEGEPILDNVHTFEVRGLNKKNIGITYNNVYQAVEVILKLGAPNLVEGESELKTKNYKFITRVKNVSIIK